MRDLDSTSDKAACLLMCRKVTRLATPGAQVHTDPHHTSLTQTQAARTPSCAEHGAEIVEGPLSVVLCGLLDADLPAADHRAIHRGLLGRNRRK